MRGAPWPPEKTDDPRRVVLTRLECGWEGYETRCLGQYCPEHDQIVFDLENS